MLHFFERLKSAPSGTCRKREKIGQIRPLTRFLATFRFYQEKPFRAGDRRILEGIWDKAARLAGKPRPWH